MGFVTLTVSIAVLCCLVTANNNTKIITDAFIHEYMQNLTESKYSIDVMPIGNDGKGSKIAIQCELIFSDVHKVDDRNMNYQLQAYLTQYWNDSRLAFPDKNMEEIVLDDTERVWKANLHFLEEKEGFKHNLVEPNNLIRIYPDGDVFYAVRLTVTLSCPMDFTKFPHDVQRCVASILDFNYYKELELSWQTCTKAVDGPKKITDLQFELKKIEHYTKLCNKSCAEYTTLKVAFTFHRKAGFFMTRMYIPFIFLIVLSWSSFWIPVKLTSLRLSLLLLIMFMMINIASSVNDFIPPTPYTKASDVWIAVCESLVFAAFLEFIVAHIISKNEGTLEKNLLQKDIEDQNVLDKNSRIKSMSNGTSNSTVAIVVHHLKKDVLVKSGIDKISKIAFPVLFLFFNFIYWLVYCT